MVTPSGFEVNDERRTIRERLRATARLAGVELTDDRLDALTDSWSTFDGLMKLVPDPTAEEIPVAAHSDGHADHG
jgi:hypothetical protein